MSWRSRLASLANRLLGIEQKAEAVEREIAPATTKAFDFDQIIPEIGSLPPPEPQTSNQIEDFADFVDLLDLRDSYAQNLLDKGWFDLDVDADTRHNAREAFFDYTGFEEDEFPWDDWREWYESQ